MGIEHTVYNIHTSTPTYTYTRERQLNIAFLDVSYYAEYPDTNILNSFLTKA